MGQLSDSLVAVVHSFTTREAAEQGGIISGDNPVVWSKADPLRLWVIQLFIIVSMTQFLSLIFSRIRQPRVIAEVIGGVLLGPTVMGRIPKFHDTIFPDSGMPSLTLTSTIGLVFFLFLVGLEIDTRVIKRNVVASSAVSAAGLLIPLGLGAALGVGVYKQFISDEVNQGHFVLFTAVAVGITAFPVLCRILTETKLLEDVVGVVVLAAGVGNDVVGWVLLALTVTLVNASSGLTALWVLLSCVGFVLFLFFPVKWGFAWLARKTGSLDQGSPTAFMMTVTLLLVLASAFFTDIIGVHAIFGGFVAGLIIPHDNGFAISLVEKLEDLVSILFLPIYFTLSGLRTNLGSLDTGVAWGYTIIICLVAFVSKFCACGLAAYFTGFNWRASAAIGSLMSCKGLVELIVLNIGRDAKILDERTFSMFVLHAIVLTFITTPLTLVFYPPKHRLGRGQEDRSVGGDIEEPKSVVDNQAKKTRFSIVLERIEQVPAAMTLSQLLLSKPASPPSTTDTEGSSISKATAGRELTMDALRLIELTNRTSAVLKSQEAESLILTDPVLSVYRTFGGLNDLSVSTSLSVVSYDEYCAAVTSHVKQSNSQMVLLPWSAGPSSDANPTPAPAPGSFDMFFHRTNSKESSAAPPLIYSEFIRNVFLNSPVDVGVYIDRPLSVNSKTQKHLVLPFFGGPDDRLALSFVAQICARKQVSASIIRVEIIEKQDLTPVSTMDLKVPTAQQTIAAPDTVYGLHDTNTRLASNTADNVLWTQYAQGTDPAFSSMTFHSVQSAQPLHAALEFINGEVKANKNVVTVMGRSRRLATGSHAEELSLVFRESGGSYGASVSKTLGDVGAAVLVAGQGPILVIQAAA